VIDVVGALEVGDWRKPRQNDCKWDRHLKDNYYMPNINIYNFKVLLDISRIV
jgi:ribosomal protein L32E